ncbi:oxidation resistance protein 1 [Colletotrichum tofieldiae]|nr:oxidation resistance protein 1 [Colletotrichum tofieldiae]
MLPERLRIMEDWKLIYSLEQDGASLTTLYQKAADYQGRRVGFVLVVRDDAGGDGSLAKPGHAAPCGSQAANQVFMEQTFGAYLSEYPHPAPKYFGNGECFLWRASTLTPLPPPPSADTTNLTRITTRPADPVPGPSESIRFKAFPYSGVNDYYINCETGFLSVGAGDGHYGLWLDDSLDRGHSGRSHTFGNEPLSDEGEKFGVLGVELWVLGLEVDPKHHKPTNNDRWAIEYDHGRGPGREDAHIYIKCNSTARTTGWRVLMVSKQKGRGVVE